MKPKTFSTQNLFKPISTRFGSNANSKKERQEKKTLKIFKPPPPFVCNYSTLTKDIKKNLRMGKKKKSVTSYKNLKKEIFVFLLGTSTKGNTRCFSPRIKWNEFLFGWHCVGAQHNKPITRGAA